MSHTQLFNRILFFFCKKNNEEEEKSITMKTIRYNLKMLGPTNITSNFKPPSK